jgi:subtilisin-like proprotein convertase family protein
VLRDACLEVLPRSACVALAILGATAAPASAVTYTNPQPIAVPGSGTSGTAAPYPSEIHVSGFTGLLEHIELRLVGVTHGNMDDLDVLLVSPTGSAALVLSDAGGASDLQDDFLLFDDNVFPLDRRVPDAGPGDGGIWRSSVYAPADSFPQPAPPGPYANGISSLEGVEANGTWRLFVLDDLAPGAGTIAGGWELRLFPQARATNAAPIEIPNFGIATPYASEIAFSGLAGTVETAKVRLHSLTHPNPDDLDIVVESPSGVPVALVSDAGGSADVASAELLFDDADDAEVPDAGPLTAGIWVPGGIYDFVADELPAPGPGTPWGGGFVNLGGALANGTWRLWVADDNIGSAGEIAGGWTLELALRPGVAASFATGTATVPEGGTVEATVGRVPQGERGSVRVSTLAGTADAGQDFVPLEQRLEFPGASGGTQEQALQLSTSQDGADEPDETFQVVLDQPLDNLSVAEPRTMIVTIVDDDPPVPPELTALRLAPRRFRAFRRRGPSATQRRPTRGSRVSFTLSESATVGFGLDRAAAGRRLGKRCVKPTRGNRLAPRCLRWVRLRGGFTRSGHEGANSFRFTGRLRRRPLQPRRYRLRARARDTTGLRSPAVRARFRIVSGEH